MKNFLVLSIIALSLTLSKVAPAAQANPLRGELELLTSQHSDEDVQYGITIRDLETGQVIYEKDSDLLLNPASNTKVLTTLSALALLGPDFKFKTQFLSDASPDKGHLSSLVLKGFGDPSFSTDRLKAMVKNLWQQGVRQVDSVVVDGSYFDGEEFPGQMEGRQRDAGFNCSVGALSIDHNQLEVVVTPSTKAGAAAEVKIEPPLASFPISGEILTAKGKGRGRVIVRNDPEAQGLGIAVKGSISAQSEAQNYKISIHESLELAGIRLIEALREQGIQVPDRAVPGKSSEKSKVLAESESQGLSEIIQEINKHSDNFMAEQLTKSLGARFSGIPGSTEKGVAVILKKLREMGIHTQGIELENGSGLSKKTRLRPQTLAEVLEAAYRDPKLRIDFISSLSVLGVDGTLKKKFRHSDLAGRFLGKTGTLNGVSSLSGYAFPKNSEKSHPFVFSFILNGKGKNFWKEKQLAQDILETLLNQ